MNIKCDICKKVINNNSYGNIESYDGLNVHYFCLLLSTNLAQAGNEDEGILGFLANDIRKYINKNEHYICPYCNSSSATVLCRYKNCSCVFHPICGFENNCFSQFKDSFKSYCNKHAGYVMEDLKCYDINNKKNCNLCESLIDSPIAAIPSCCKNTWVHRECLQKIVMESQDPFSCFECCNIDEEYTDSVRCRGVYIPFSYSQDDSSIHYNSTEEVSLLSSHSPVKSNNSIHRVSPSRPVCKFTTFFQYHPRSRIEGQNANSSL